MFESIIYISMGCIPFLCLFFTILLYTKVYNIFDSIINGSISWGVLLVFETYILSFMHLISQKFILLFWALYISIILYLIFKSNIKINYKKFKFINIYLFIILFTTFATAIIYPPNNWDSMTYHLPKIMHWLQNNSLTPYNTPIPRQNTLAPFAEMVILQSYALSTTDYLANLVQWFAFLGMIIATAATASQLGATKTGQYAAALFIATLPMAIAQASSTQTDNVVGFWLICSANRFLAWSKESNFLNSIYFGSAVALAILTKGTAYPLAFPFVAVFGYMVLKNIRKFFLQGAVAALIIIVINAPFLYNNYIKYQNIFGDGSSTIITSPTPITLCANFVGNILSNDPALFAKKEIEDFYISTFNHFGIKKHDPILFPWGDITARSTYTTHEDVAQNPVHMLILIIIIFFYSINILKLEKIYTRCTLMSIILFCLLLNWQPWITRLQVPIFALFAVLFGLTYEQITQKYIKIFVIFILCIFGLPSLFFLKTRPLIESKYFNTQMYFMKSSREKLYFSNRHYLFKDYNSVIDFIVKEQQEKIYIYIGGDSWEYPLWVLFKEKTKKTPQIYHMTSIEEIYSKKPKYLIAIDMSLPHDKNDKTNPKLYKYTSQGYIRDL